MCFLLHAHYFFDLVDNGVLPIDPTVVMQFQQLIVLLHQLGFLADLVLHKDNVVMHLCFFELVAQSFVGLLEELVLVDLFGSPPVDLLALDHFALVVVPLLAEILLLRVGEERLLVTFFLKRLLLLPH